MQYYSCFWKGGTSLFNERTLYSIPNNTGYVRTVPMGNSYSATSITRAYLDKVDQLGYTKMAIHSKKVSCQWSWSLQDEIRDGPLKKLWEGWEFSSSMKKQFPCMNFLGLLLEYFLGYLAYIIFFHLIFPCTNIFFFVLHPPPNKFPNGLSLSNMDRN